MFKEALKGATAKVFSGVKKSGSYLGGLVLEEGVASLTRRSPLLGGYADKVINNIQAERSLNKLRAATAKNYIETAETGESKEFKEKVKSEHKPGTDDKKIQADMASILVKLQKMVDKTGKEEAKKTEFFKTYEKYFEDYKKHEEQTIKDSAKDKTTENKKTEETSSTEENNTNNTNNVQNSTEQLDKIETNTKNTVETLTKLTDDSVSKKPEGTIVSALDQLGGKLIDKFVTGKLFKPKEEANAISGKAIEVAKDQVHVSEPIASKANEEANEPITKDTTEVNKEIISVTKETLIEAKKTNEFLNVQNIKAEEKSIIDAETLAETRKSSVSDSIEKLSEKLSTSIASLQETLKSSVENRIDSAKSAGPDLDIDIDKPGSKNRKSKRQTKKERIAARRKLAPMADKITTVGKDVANIPDVTDLPSAKKPGLPGGAKGGISGGSRFGSLLARGASGLGSLAGAASAYALPALAVAGAGAAGYAAGTVLNSGISSGLSAMTGKETTLGGWLYDKFNDDPNSPEAQAKYAASPEGQAQIAKSKATMAAEKTAVTKSAASVGAVKPAIVEAAKVVPTASVEAAKVVPTASVEAAKSTQVPAAQAALNKQETIAAQPPAPIIINNNTSNSSSSGSSGGGGGIVVTSPVRNTESSFERVQMQDFWPRAA